MKIPSIVNISGVLYAVPLVSSAVNNSLQETIFRGKIDLENCIITLNKDCNNQVMEQAFFHEVIHGIASAFKLTLSEDDTDRIAWGIYQVLKENGLLKE